MFNRLTRTYAAVGLIVILFICTVQLLRAPSSDARTQQPASTAWRDWVWPAEQGNSEYDWSKAGMIGQKQGSSESTEHTSSSGSKGKEGSSETPEGPDWLGAIGKHSSAINGHVTSVKEDATKATVTVTVTQTVPTTVQAHSTAKCNADKAWEAAALAALNTTFHVPDDIKYSPDGPRPDQIVVVTASDGKGHNGGIPNILERAEENRKAYCAHHGYHYHFVNISKFDLSGAHPVWKKLPAIVDAFNTYPEAQWVFFLDLDAIIMTPKQDLNSLVLSHKGMREALNLGAAYSYGDWTPLGVWQPDEPDLDNIDMLIAQDHNGINAGSFFLRRSKFTQWLLDMWADPFFMRMDWPGQEQDTLLHFVKHHHTFRSHLGLIRQRINNAYPEGGDQMRWMEGDLVVHLAGCWVADKCQERFEEFWNKREIV